MSYDDAWLDAHNEAKKTRRRERAWNTAGIALAALLIGITLWGAIVTAVNAAW